VSYVLNVVNARETKKSVVMSQYGNITLHTTLMLMPRSRHCEVGIFIVDHGLASSVPLNWSCISYHAIKSK
jgi:hypothetical protein